nr:unnamed protein product [Spirometra erinaceieuropaei]
MWKLVFSLLVVIGILEQVNPAKMADTVVNKDEVSGGGSGGESGEVGENVGGGNGGVGGGSGNGGDGESGAHTPPLSPTPPLLLILLLLRLLYHVLIYLLILLLPILLPLPVILLPLTTHLLLFLPHLLPNFLRLLLLLLLLLLLILLLLLHLSSSSYSSSSCSFTSPFPHFSSSSYSHFFPDVVLDAPTTRQSIPTRTLKSPRAINLSAVDTDSRERADLLLLLLLIFFLQITGSISLLEVVIEVHICGYEVMERLIKGHFMLYLEQRDLVWAAQHGFRRSHSCLTSSLYSQEKWTRAIDQGRPVDVIFFDFKKAFDSVPHGRLLQML